MRDSLSDTLVTDSVQFLLTATQDLAAASDLAGLVRVTAKVFLRASGCPNIGLWCVDVHRGGFQNQPLSGRAPISTAIPQHIPTTHPLPALLLRHPHPMTVQELSIRLEPAGEGFSGRNIALCPSGYIVPLAYTRQLVGFVLLESAHESCIAKPETLPMLEVLAATAAIALNHIISNDAAQCSHTLMRRTDRLRSVEIIAGGFAHEVRNPLTSIKTFIQLAPERQHDTGFIREFSRLAIEDIHRIEQLLQNILDYARYTVHTPTEEDINELVSSCLSFISINAANRGIEVKTELADDLPSVFVDRQQIKQVVINLLLNALDSLRDGSREIIVRTRPECKPDGTMQVCIEVQDDGEGIAADLLEHIFDPFFTTKHSNSMTDPKGLGLTIAHQILREHQAELWVDSTQGIGSTFRVLLPAGLRSSLA